MPAPGPRTQARSPWNSVVSGWISTTEQREDAWKFCASAVERHYEERLKRWNAELDMLLVFAGLFSTALTAFIVQSYPLLQPDNTDTVVLALAQISNQLQGLSVSPPVVNSTQRSVFSPEGVPFKAPDYAIWVNGLWFSSLICTLAASSVAVLVKQWLHQYSQSLSGMSPDIARLRQYRYDSLNRWQVPEIIAALPILLQLALALFLAGLIVLLWNLHPSVAISATVLSSIVAIFIIVTTLLPIFYNDCCYQSPQALIFFFLAQGLVHSALKIVRAIERRAQEAALEVTSRTSRKYVVLAHTRDAARVVLKRLGAWGSFRTWHAREKPNVEERHAELEQSLALTAYYVTLNDSMITTAIIPCLAGMDALSARMSVRYGNLVRDVTAGLPRGEWRAWRPLMPFVLTVFSLITRDPSKGVVKKVLQVMPRSGAQSSARTKLGMLYLLAMSQLVSRRIAARVAFHNMLVYLQSGRIDIERSAEPGATVLDDVEAVFPTTDAELEELVNFDKLESVSYYLTGIEYIIKYLLKHRVKLEQDGSPVPDRILALVDRFRLLLRSPVWTTQRSRQGVVLQALRYSQLLPLMKQLKHEKHIPEISGDEMLHDLKEAFGVLECLRASNVDIEQMANQDARLALSLIQKSLDNFERELRGGARGSDSVTEPSSTSELRSNIVKVSEQTTVKDKQTTKTSTESSGTQVDLPDIAVTSPSNDSTWNEEPSRTMEPWLDSLLDTIDPELSFFEEDQASTACMVDEFPDTPLADPNISLWLSQTAPIPQTRRHDSRPDSLTATGQHIFRLRAASRYLALPSPKPYPGILPPEPPRSSPTSAVPTTEVDIGD
ncbi:hypothetical protein BD311DRAFT_446354 [Dichomitus squalens]|uniref:DUF6535 domain-containing protein n=1 Tax=Dichomitus squalens TaxID=114155 RepID=A0A4V6MVW0_9APHY|nr:hypothetical protein BD311DRAFT_446354 [Dichomitus squalens]